MSSYRAWEHLDSPQMAAAGSVGAMKNSANAAMIVTTTTEIALAHRWLR